MSTIKSRNDSRRHTIGPTEKKPTNTLKKADKRLSLGSTKMKLSTGPESLHLMTLGTRVARGPDWKWGEQNESHSNVGTVIDVKEGWIEVHWDNGFNWTYRMGAENCYDLQLADIEIDDKEGNLSDNSMEDTSEVLQLKSFLKKDITKLKKWPISEDVSKALFTSPLPSHLECEICLDVLNDPVQTSCCGQSYCKNCVDQLQSQVCPHCRANLEFFPDKKSVRLINDLEIKCPFYIGKRCRWKGCASELKNHFKNCDIKPITCSFGCGKLFEKRNMEAHSFFCSHRLVSCKYCIEQIKHKDKSEHYGICPKMPLPCPNNCSSKEELTREKMKDHIEECPEQEVSCKYFEFGCDIKVKRKDYDHHLSSTFELHLYLTVETARSEQNARKALEEKVKALENEIDQIKNQHNEDK